MSEITEENRDYKQMFHDAVKDLADALEENERLRTANVKFANSATLDIEKLREELAHSKQMYDQVYDDRERMRAELDQVKSHGPEGRNYTNAEYVSLLQERESLRTELAEKDKVLEWYGDEDRHMGSVPHYQSLKHDCGERARSILSQYKKGDTIDASKDA